MSICLFSFACGKSRPAPGAGRPPAAPPSPKLFAAEIRYDVPAADVKTVPLEKASQVLRLRQVVKPDRRFLGAVAELAAILASKPPAVVTAAWKESHWSIQIDGAPVGDLPPLPSFGEALGLLRRQASDLSSRANLRSGGNVQGDLSFASFDLFSLEPTKALHDAEKRWQEGERDFAVLDLAGRALVALSVQSVDRVGVADPLYARALALLGIRQALSGKEYLEDEAVLARLTGYEAEAFALGKKLPADSPVGLFVENWPIPLRRVAEKKDASRSTKYLFLLSYGDRSGMARWSKWVEEFCDPDAAGLPLYRAAMDVEDFGPDRGNAELMLYAVTEQLSDANAARRFWTRFFAELRQQPGTRDLRQLLSLLGVQEPKPSHGILERFERTLASTIPLKGTFSGGEPERCWYRSFFYSALYGIGTFELDERGSAPSAVAFGEYLDNATSGAAPDFRRWFLDVARTKNDQRNLPSLVADVGELRWLGLPAVQRAMDESMRLLPASDPHRARLARDYVARIDTRGAGRTGMHNICWVEWLDLKCYETYRTGSGRLLYGSGGDPGYFVYLDDRDAIRKMVDNTDVPLARRRWAVKTLVDQGWIDESKAAAKYEELYRIDRDWMFEPFVGYLRHHGMYRKAESVVREVIARTPQDAAPLERARYAALLAESLEKQGRLEEAWRTVEPWIDTWKGDVMDTAASVLESRGHHEEALELQRKSLDRYADNASTRGAMLMILWRQAKYADVVPVLSDPRHLPGPLDMREEIVPDFAEVFRKQSVEETRKAFTPLLDANFNPWILNEFAAGMAKVNRYDAAFALLTDLTKRRPGIGKSALDPALKIYRYLAKSRDETAALAWMKGVVTDDVREGVLAAAFNERLFALFWQTVPDPARSSDRVWFLEAAAAALAPDEARDNRELLNTHFRAASGPNADYGRYLLGLADDAPVFRAAASKGNRGNAAYVLGLRALADGRYADASDWFLVCRENDNPSTFARQGSEAVLKRWISDAHPMQMLADRKIF